MDVETILAGCVAGADSREEFWVRFLHGHAVEDVAEVGVLRGQFAERVLQQVPSIRSYRMVDPWRHLDDWNKPANRDDDAFEQVYREAMQRTQFAADRREVLRGKTSEVADRMADGSLDFAYIDADHTLRGITIGLALMFPKIRDGGWLGGDDFSPSIWQHARNFEPTLVFPYAVYFAEAMRVPIYALPWNQFLLRKSAGEGFRFVDLAGRYGDTGLRGRLAG